MRNLRIDVPCFLLAGLAALAVACGGSGVDDGSDVGGASAFSAGAPKAQDVSFSCDDDGFYTLSESFKVSWREGAPTNAAKLTGTNDAGSQILDANGKKLIVRFPDTPDDQLFINDFTGEKLGDALAGLNDCKLDAPATAQALRYTCSDGFYALANGHDVTYRADPEIQRAQLKGVNDVGNHVIQSTALGDLIVRLPDDGSPLFINKFPNAKLGDAILKLDNCKKLP
jgi:hypothetical protein